MSVKPLLILRPPIVTHQDRPSKSATGIFVASAQSLLSRGHTLIGVSRPSFSAEKGVEAERKITVKRILFNEIGLELSEYAVAAALITAAILVAFMTLGNIVTNTINTLANLI